MQRIPSYTFLVLLLLTMAMGLVLPCVAQWTPLNPITGIRQQPDGVEFTLKSGHLKIQVCSDSILRMLYSATDSFPTRFDPVVIKKNWPKAAWTLEQNDTEVTIVTSRLRVVVTRKDGAISYRDVTGAQIVQEAGRKLTPVKVNGEDTYRAESFINMYGSREALYGLGQHQAGVWNYRGESVDISQDNTNIAVPLLVSSNGYGIFWNNASRSRFNNRFANYLYISSDVADVIDYYLFYGPEPDKIIASYRELTGQVPMFGKWAYGFWQCKNRYKSQDEILGVARKYRELHIPADNIVQDWFWWNRKGEFVFNKNYPDPKGMVDELHRDNFHLMISIWPFFEPGPGASNYDYMDKQGWFIEKFKYAKPPYHTDAMAVYDATRSEARKFYWDQIDKSLFKIGLDAWWMDTTEPETEGQEENIQLGHKLAAGSGDRYVNLYPMLTTGAVYDGQRIESDQKRVFILSRSAFAGSQRSGVTAWSGDINSDWFSYRRQIPAGLNFALSGIPYWTTDIGGFVFGDPDDPAYRELFVRWFQYGTFNPILRAHGTRKTDQNELWSYGPDAQKILVAFDRLRYRLLPYIYSLAWKTTSDSYTPMRPLVMDFRTDVRAQNTGDEFMYGPAFLVSPVTEPAASTRQVYLPNAKWVDFWTGATSDGGSEVTAAAPSDRLPLYIRAGSIVPMGPDLEWSTQKPADPIELRVYRGADASFTLYEDENDTYNYEKGAYATIALHWDDAGQTLAIENRHGSFPGMLASRTFNVVFVGDNHGVGIGAVESPDKVVSYSGKAVTVTP
ncbi:MAG TPA: glycoside hydrolase family 31 protein [Terriglobales bacterium]|jgi:alpha-D-xyloside xylohydrolase|nr:glycoside hydrolase family 31 protein [Terriglobales bacterium]